MKTNETIIFVHPFTTVEFTLARAKDRGYKIVTIKTPYDKVWIEQCWQDIEKYSDYIFESQGNVEADLTKLNELLQTKHLKTVGVMNCFDGSLHYSDYLANQLLGHNLDLEYSALRLSKFLVNEKLKVNHINYIKGIFIDSMEDFKRQLDQIQQFKFPFIVKPAGNSAARTDVKLIYSFADLEKTVPRLLAKTNLFASKEGQQLLIQEFISGEEYNINSVSFGGKHFSAGVFKHRKEGSQFKGIDIVEPRDKAKMDILMEYNFKCLDALKVQYGITHNEIILTAEGIPYLVEMNNRMSGVDIPLMSMDCYGVNEIDIYLDVIAKKPFPVFEHKINRYGVKLLFSNFFVDDPTHLNLADIVSDARQFVFRPAKIDKEKPIENDLYFKVSAGVYLSHFSKAQLEKDIAILLAREQEGSLFLK